ncbi:hypothetical protein SH661x_003440 [Planctomicrobium sp. SH661]|uniref:hypothetical protein n=1 Tax=Planctomicrobium sp. SH661 TaxID=3448124 RepID=UPI003F5C43E1
MRRFLVTFITVTTLAAAYRVYSAVLIPLTEMKEIDRPLVDPMESDLRGPAAFEQQAAQVFPEFTWTHRAQQTWQMAEHAYLYFNEYERVPGAGNSIQISPVAIYWQDPKRPGSKPFRVLADRAQIKFQNSFFDAAIALSSVNPGRIVWASLEGPVHIDGPDGLTIDGQNFKFEEDSSQLYSDHAIAFSYGPTEQDQRRISGTADQLQLAFTPSQESILGKDMPRVGGLAQILLRRNVVLDMTFQQQGEDRQAKITSAGSFLYDVLKREATLDDQVRVVHIADPARTARKDTIECAWMQLQFDSTSPADPVSETSPAKAFDGLVFRSMRAQGSDNGRGSRLKVTSDEQQLAAVMQDLTYDASRRRAVFIDQQQVVIHRGEVKFVCPQIGLQHSEDNQIEYLECRGAGQMDVRQSRPDAPPMMARWGSKVQVRPDPQARVHHVRIEEQALLGVPGQFGLGADVIHLWVDLDRIQKESQGASQPQSADRNFLASALPLKRARAENHVRLDSQLLKVERSNLIDVVIHPGLIDNPLKNSTSSNGNSSANEADQPWIVSADALNLEVVHDSGKALIDVRQVTGAGNIVIQHDPGRATTVGNQSIDGPLVLKGSSLVVQNQGGVQQILTVRGEIGPQGESVQNASIGIGQAALWGNQITMARHENRVDVPCAGGLSVPIPQNLNASGGTAASATKLDIVWQEGMTFDGLDARFWGKVTAAVPGEQQSVSRLLCEDLTATLNQRISFIESPESQTDVTISEVAARHNVVVESVEYQQNRLAAVRRSKLAGFHVNLTSGDFKGDGPGVIDSWSLGDAVKFSPGENPQANAPAKQADARWRYSNVQFAGTIDGNMNRNDATLKERVEVLTAPVERAQTRFQREQLSESTPEAANAVWMKCDQMRIIQKQFSSQVEKSYEVFATGGTELEGQVFRAVADELTFDERRGQFTLRGLGKEARLYYQASAGETVSPSAARLIEFVPVKRKITIDGSSGFSGSY